MARALRTLDPTLVRRLAASRQRLSGPALAAALQELAAFLGATAVDLRQLPPTAWRPAFA